MPNLKNYGTNDYPIWMCDPPLTANASTTTPYNRYDQGMVSAANMIEDIKDLITGGTIGNTMFFGTAVSGTEGDISVTVSGSKITLNGRSVTVVNQHKLKGTYAKELSAHGCGACCAAFALTLRGRKTAPAEVLKKAVSLWGK